MHIFGLFSLPLRNGHLPRVPSYFKEIIKQGRVLVQPLPGGEHPRLPWSGAITQLRAELGHLKYGTRPFLRLLPFLLIF